MKNPQITKKYLISSLTAGLTLGLVSTVSAATTFNGGPTDDIALAGNWNNGLPTGPGNPGTLDTTAEWLPANPTLTNFYLDIIAGGTLNREDFFQPQTIDGGVWTINGGSIINTTAVNLSDDAQVTLNTGAITMGGGRDLGINGTSLFTIGGGTLTIGDELNMGGGSFTMNGGTTVINGSGNVGDNFGSNGTFNFDGGSFTAGNYGANAGTIGVRTVNFGAGSGSVDFTGDFEAFRTTIDWVAGSGMSLTIAGALSNSGAATTFEDLYTGGQLLYEGSNANPFGDNFQVTGSTLSLIPEPSSVALLGLAGLAVCLRRRR